MKLKFTLALTALITSSLIGCSGGSVSATSDQAQSSSTDHSSIVSRIKSIFKSDTDSFKIEMPASSLIIEASKDWIEKTKTQVINMPWDYDYNMCINSPEIKKITNYDRGGDLTTGLKELIKQEPTGAYLLKVNPDKICSRFFLSDSSRPLYGWAKQASHEGFAKGVFLNGYVANALETQVISRLGTTKWKNNILAKDEINKILDDLVSSGQYHQIVADAVIKINNSKILIDGTMKLGAVAFTLDDYNVEGGEAGIIMKKNGSNWFGNGAISGKTYNVMMETVEVRKMEKSKTIDTGEGVKTEINNTDSAGVGN